jgi:hypothetical protein
MHQFDAIFNGLAFISLVVGLAIGWTRSRALRETVVELFLPTHQARASNHAGNGAFSDTSADQITITWEVYRALAKTAPSSGATTADDPQTLSSLREFVGV